MLLPDLAATEALGRRLAPLIRPGDQVLLEGPLGAGKSALARAILRTLTADPNLEVPSPTYTLVQAYETPIGLVHHFDLWRLDHPSAAAIAELGWHEADIALVEWPDRLGSLRPAAAPTVTLAHAAPGAPADARTATLSGWPLPDREGRA